MAKIQVQALGGSIQQKDARNVKELKEALNLPNHQATVNGEPVSDDHEFSDYEFVTLTEKVKGA
jgi:sulfur carrier protein ThiS